MSKHRLGAFLLLSFLSLGSCAVVGQESSSGAFDSSEEQASSSNEEASSEAPTKHSLVFDGDSVHLSEGTFSLASSGASFSFAYEGGYRLGTSFLSLSRNASLSSLTPLPGIESVEFSFSYLGEEGEVALLLGDEGGYYARLPLISGTSLAAGTDFSYGYSAFRLETSCPIALSYASLSFIDEGAVPLVGVSLETTSEDAPFGSSLSSFVGGVSASFADGSTRLLAEGEYSLVSEGDGDPRPDALLGASHAGTAHLRASYLGVSSAQASFRVHDPEETAAVTAISLPYESAVYLYPGETLAVPYELSPSGAEEAVAMSSDNPSVLAVEGTRIHALESGNARVSLRTSAASASFDVIVIDDERVEVAPGKLTARDFGDRYAPSLGEQKILVVPVQLAGSTSFEWNEAELQAVEEATFSYDRFDSLVSYYERASNGRLCLSGEVAGTMDNMFQSSYSESYLSNDPDGSRLLALFEECLDWLYAQDIDLDSYDSDDDGHIDSIHFFVDGGGNADWQSSLWPHMATVAMEAGTLEEPTIMSYSLSNLGFLGSSAIATIHEQGHIYGIEDYYDYSGYIDCLGGFDMQDMNMGDWNSFSKMALGWVDPLYANLELGEEIEIELAPAALGGSPLVLATDWNGTAYDEYVLLELFSRYGNNEISWDEYSSSYGDLGEGGIRLYHVDARLASRLDSSGLLSYVDDSFLLQSAETREGTSYQVGHNNSFYGSDYASDNISADRLTGVSEYYLLNLIQKGGTNTFADPYSRDKYLDEDDLFLSGDSFSVDGTLGTSAYGEEFFRNGDSFNNGDEFPYVIEFLEVTPTGARVRIYRGA